MIKFDYANRYDWIHGGHYLTDYLHNILIWIIKILADKPSKDIDNKKKTLIFGNHHTLSHDWRRIVAVGSHVSSCLGGIRRWGALRGSVLLEHWSWRIWSCSLCACCLWIWMQALSYFPVLCLPSCHHAHLHNGYKLTYKAAFKPQLNVFFKNVALVMTHGKEQ